MRDLVSLFVNMLNMKCYPKQVFCGNISQSHVSLFISILLLFLCRHVIAFLGIILEN